MIKKGNPIIYGIILASGDGIRTGLNIPKQFLKIGGKTVVEHAIEVFEKVKAVDKIIIVCHGNYLSLMNTLLLKNNYKKVVKVLVGGATRRESSYLGVNAIKEQEAQVLIHDAARPFLSEMIVLSCLEALKTYQAVDVAIRSTDTIIKIKQNNIIEQIPKREYLRCGQTPQAFDVRIIKQAHELANQEGVVDVTDDCGLVLKYGLSEIYVVEGDQFNRKITDPIDVAIADKLFQLKSLEINDVDKRALKNKVLVIFGASRGIGAAIAEMAQTYGAKVYGFSRATKVDVTDLKSLKRALDLVFKKEHQIDYIINTAGILRMGKLNDRSMDDILREININYVGCVNVAHLAPEYLKRTAGSLLLYTSSSYTKGRALYSIYSSTKAAIVNLTQALSEEWQAQGIKINCICPERTATLMRLENFGQEPEETLCPVAKVASVSLNTLLTNVSGQIVNVKRA